MTSSVFGGESSAILDERSRTAIELDPILAARRKRKREEWIHTVLIPRMRLLGLLVLGFLVFLHNRAFGTGEDRAAVAFSLVALVYAALSWLALRFLYKRMWPFDLGFAFLIADLFVLAAAIYSSGGEKSWLFPVLLIRTADQASASYRRTLFFSQATVVAYLALVAWLAWGEGREIDPASELVKALLLYCGNLYVTMTARAAAERRRRVSAAIEMTREAIRRAEANAAEIEEARSRAEIASEAKSQFLAHVSHEIRSPMNEVLGISDMLLLGELDEKRKEWLGILRTSGGTLLKVIDDVLDYSKIEAGELVLEPANCNLHSLAAGALQPLLARADTKGLTIRQEVDSGVPETVRADPIRLGQILVNLMSNAVSYTSEGRVDLRIGVEEVIDETRAWIRFEVEDTGIGISKKTRDQLFEPFQRSDAGMQHGGSGLELPMSQRLVEQMGGRIEVESTKDGSRFFFALPLVIVSGIPEPAPLPDKPREAPPEGRQRVLLVEDEEVSRQIERHLLRSLGLRVTAVANGREALDTLEQSESFDLVLMDCQMPVMDGYEATREIRRREGSQRHTPIVALTAHALTGDRERCLAAGMDDYIPKPVSRDVLADVLSSWVEIDD